jgi:hypothetical protein
MESAHVTISADDFKDRITSWSDLSALVEHFSYFNGHDWLFRGASDAGHRLIPKVGRQTIRATKLGADRVSRTRVPYRIEDERAVFSMFRQQARPHLPLAPQSSLEWLAIAQHFGLPTRLLDWTDGLLVATWFAVESGGAKKADSAIWVTRGIPSIDIDDPQDPLSIAEATAYRAPHLSPRIGAQGSALLICPSPAEEVQLEFVRKITIDRAAEFTIKKRLNACGINRRHLFPDLAGLSEHLGWLYKNDWLAGYRAPCSYWEAPADDPPDEASE